MAGGNVMAVAQRHGIAGLVVDGVIRDVAEAREAAFPVFGRGVVPIPGDIVVADEEGVVAVPAARRDEVFAAARAKLAKDSAESLDDWERTHRARIDKILAEGGFEG